MKFRMILDLEGCFERETMAGLPLPAASVQAKDTVWILLRVWHTVIIC